jgi:pimeloyl-ACP methyl ester carboxylesterase
MGRFMLAVYAVVTRQSTVAQVMSQFFPKIDQARIEWFTQTLSCVDPELVRVLVEDRYFEGLDLRKLLGQVTCPVLMLHGDRENGSFVRDSDLEFFLTYTARAEATRIPGAGHFLHAEQPTKVLQLVNQWMRRFGEFA